MTGSPDLKNSFFFFTLAFLFPSFLEHVCVDAVLRLQGVFHDVLYGDFLEHHG